MADLVQYERRGSIGVITVNNPPVNALSQGVRQGLQDCLAKGIADASAKALVLIGGGRTFIAGADIREFGRPPLPPDLNTVIAQYESSPKLVVAAIHGTALGGGLEVAFGCHYRCAVASGQVGFPEVKLGLLPGAGGTQRLPRLTGPEAALPLIVAGDPIPAAKALALGIIDEIVPGDLLDGACAYAERLVAEGKPLRKIRDMQDKVRGTNPTVFAEFRKGLERSARASSPRSLRGRGGGRRHPTLRRRAHARAGALRPVHAVHAVEGADPRVLLRARGHQDPRRAQGDAGQVDRERRGDRRRHHGRRHRHELRQRGYPGARDRDESGGAGPGPRGGAEELRRHRGQGPAQPEGHGHAHGPDPGHARL
jgi:enoyl-CoA hydratase/carnithine racemase